MCREHARAGRGGGGYWRNGLCDEAVVAFSRLVAINPRHLASARRPRAADRLAEVRAERARVARAEAAAADDAALRTFAAGTAARADRLAALLEARGETVAARGHRLRALERAAGLRTAPDAPS